jgi:hypothetical protein
VIVQKKGEYRIDANSSGLPIKVLFRFCIPESMTHTISVIAPHIERGSPRSPNSCPLALALIQHFGRLVQVGKTLFWFDDSQVHFWYKVQMVRLPTVAIQFQNDFDRGFKTLQPFTFNVEIS